MPGKSKTDDDQVRTKAQEQLNSCVGAFGNCDEETKKELEERYGDAVCTVPEVMEDFSGDGRSPNTEYVENQPAGVQGFLVWKPRGSAVISPFRCIPGSDVRPVCETQVDNLFRVMETSLGYNSLYPVVGQFFTGKIVEALQVS